ncbi:phage holin family protein [Leuconostoc mesenteroides]|uniref:phage holin family protein n=1 Tax=Leuconostoc mesenteroides TaxID=1245 RepID=UPI0023614333|nr:phage holin family protein [Leuconostoc mesenteroides]MDP0487134.1 phage holin family protein [Leuconostoc mesenteroides]
MTFNVDSNIAILVIVWLIVQVLKPTKINNHLLPLIAVIVGALVAIGLSFYTKDTKLVQDIVLGVWAGFASTGLNETATKSITSIIDGFGKVGEKTTE